MSHHVNPPSDDALDTIAYLARSENRVCLLDALSNRPYTRRDLVDATGVSSATVGRVLQELQSRGWAKRTQDGYMTTPTGTQVVDEFEPFIETIETIQHLGDAVDWIPTDELSIELYHFNDATVRRPERYDPAEVTDFFIKLLKETSSFHTLTHLVPIEAKEQLLLRGTRSGHLDVSVVVTEGLLNYLCDHPGHRNRWKNILEAGAHLSCYDERVPCNLFIFDDTLILGNSHSNSGHPYECLVSKNSTVLSWARELFDRYQGNSEDIDRDFFAAERAVPTDSRSEDESRLVD